MINIKIKLIGLLIYNIGNKKLQKEHKKVEAYIIEKFI